MEMIGIKEYSINTIKLKNLKKKVGFKLRSLKLLNFNDESDWLVINSNTVKKHSNFSKK